MRVGFVGLGDIGMPMAARLVDSGFELVAFDLDRGAVREAEGIGAVGATSLGDLDGCEVVCVAVPDDDTVAATVLDPELRTALADGAGILVHSTILPSTARRLASELEAHGVVLHDAPVSGGAARARRGELTLMVGGDPAPRAAEVLRTLGDVVGCGPVGAGAAVKLANQLSMLAALEALHEGLALAEHYGAERDTVLRVLESSTGASWSAANWGFFDELAAAYDRRGVPVRFRPWSKDLWDVVAAARAAEVRMPLAGLLAQVAPETVETHARKAQAGGADPG
jgi:3-hydroxyisobutyrate dehydrogenase-like beta-hydroxyacid dehydrogenase